MKLGSVIAGADGKEIPSSSSNPLCRLLGNSYQGFLMLLISSKRKMLPEKTCHPKIYLSGKFYKNTLKLESIF